MTAISPDISAPAVDATDQLLRRFGRRRRLLLGTRGLLAGLASLVVAMVIISLLDRLSGAGDTWRIILSCLGYALALAAAWHFGWGRLLRRDDPVALATMLESAAPALRDRLVAAVEFNRGTGRAGDGTSGAFRGQVIREAGDNAGGVHVESLLPWRRVRPSAIAAGAVVALLLIVMLLAPQWQLGRMVARALLPTAAIDPASRFTVAFADAPAQGSPRVVPIGEVETIAVDIGRRFGTALPEQVWVDVQEKTGRRTLPLFPDPATEGRYLGRGRFDGDATLIARADAARTPPLAVDAQARPTVQSVLKQTIPPSYLVNRVPTAEAVESSTGDLEALSGSTARLELRASQPLAGVDVELLTAAREPAGAAEATVSEADPFVARVSVPIDFTGYWRVRLKSAATKLSQADPPLWEVRALPDAPPHIVLESPPSPEGGNRSLSLDAVVDPGATAIDDVGLAHLRRDVRVNGGEWQTRLFEPEAGEPVREMRLPEAIDVASIAMEVGDRVEMRLLATDLRGNETAVQLGQWSVTGHAADPELARREARHRQIAEATRRLREAAQRLAETLATNAGETSDETADELADGIAGRQLRLAATQRLTELRRAADDVWRALLEVAPDALASRDRRDIVRLGDCMRELRTQLIPATAGALSGAGDTAGADAEQLLAVASAADDVADRMRRSDRLAAASASSVSLLADLQDGLARFESQQRQLGEAEATDRLRRRLVAVTARTAELLVMIDDAAADMSWRSPQTISLERARDDLDRADEQLRRALRNGAVGQTLQAVTNTYENALTRTVATSLAASVGLERYLEDARDALDAAVQPPLGDSAFPTVSVDALADTLMLAERVPQPDPQWLADLAGAEAALDHEAADPDSISEAVAVVRADAHLRTLTTFTAAFADARHSSTDRGRTALAFSGEWERVADHLGDIAEAEGLLDRGAFSDAASVLRGSAAPREASWLGRVIGRGKVDTDAAGAVASSARDLDTAREMIAPVVQAARDRLADPSLTLADRLADLASRTRVEAGRTDAVSRQAPGEPEAVHEISGRLDQLGGPLQAAIEDLRKDGLRQDLMTEQGRERARDADDAQLLLRRDVEAIEDTLRAAASAPEAERPQRIASSAQAQEKLGDDLDMLARHLRNRELDSDATADSRRQLRAVEEEAGVRETLEAQYERMKELAQLKDLDDTERLAALEERLAHDEKLRQELEHLASETSRRAAAELDDAAQDESQVADALERAQEDIAAAAESMRGQLPEIARQARRLAEERIEPLAGQEDPGAAGEAGRSLDAAADAADEGDAAGAAERLAAAARRLRQAERERVASARESLSEAGRIADEAVRNGLQNVEEAGKKVSGLQKAAEVDRQTAQELADAAREADSLQRMARDADGAEEAAQAAEASSTDGAAEAQGPIRDAARGAAANMARASRHQQRLGNSGQSSALGDAAAKAEAAAERVEAARSAAQQATRSAQAKPAVEAAAADLAEAAAGAEQASGGISGTPATNDSVARGLAEMLDELDQARADASAGPSPADASAGREGMAESGRPGGAGSTTAADRLAEIHARLMRQQRLGRISNAGGSGGQAGSALDGMAEPPVTGAAPSGESGGWDRLPTLETTDLTPGAHDAAPPEYRDLVDAYYRRMAERSRSSPRPPS